MYPSQRPSLLTQGVSAPRGSWFQASFFYFGRDVQKSFTRNVSPRVISQMWPPSPNNWQTARKTTKSSLTQQLLYCILWVHNCTYGPPVQYLWYQKNSSQYRVSWLAPSTPRSMSLRKIQYACYVDAEAAGVGKAHDYSMYPGIHAASSFLSRSENVSLVTRKMFLIPCEHGSSFAVKEWWW